MHYDIARRQRDGQEFTYHVCENHLADAERPRANPTDCDDEAEDCVLCAFEEEHDIPLPAGFAFGDPLP